LSFPGPPPTRYALFLKYKKLLKFDSDSRDIPTKLFVRLSQGTVLALHPPRRTVTPSSLQQGLVVRVDNLLAILHDGRSPVMQYGGYRVYATISFAPTVPSELLHDAYRVVSKKLINPPNLGSPFY
jgi:hypothetical protein